jgi:hypothetical protein
MPQLRNIYNYDVQRATSFGCLKQVYQESLGMSASLNGGRLEEKVNVL